MIGSRVGLLALHIRASKADPVLVSRCTALIRRVLDRVVNVLDRGERIVLIRRLEIRWRLSDTMLETEDAMQRLAADLIAALEPAWTTHLEPPRPDAEVVVFADTAAWWADALEARARGRIAWYHEPVLDTEPLSALAEPANRTLALAVMRRLGARAMDLLRDARPEVLAELADALRVTVPESLARLAAQPVDASRVDPELARLLQSLRPASTHAPEPALMGLSALALRLARAPVATPLDIVALGFSRELASGILSPPTRTLTVDAGSNSEPITLPHLQHTSYAGLLYLTTLLVELGIGEYLWTACIPEGRLFGWAATALVGDDPINRWFGGPDTTIPEVNTFQSDEVIAASCAALARTLARYRPAGEVPPLELILCKQEAVATLPNSVFPVWATACAERSSLLEAAAGLSEQWPGGLTVPVTWSGIGLGGRVRRSDHHLPRIRFRPDGPPPAARLGSVALGVAAALFEWRVGEPPERSVSDFVERFLRLGGRLEDTGESLVVHLRATDVSFPVRRAGLDRDPGYVPWLDRTVVLRFEGGEPEGDELPTVSDS